MITFISTEAQKEFTNSHRELSKLPVVIKMELEKET